MQKKVQKYIAKIIKIVIYTNFEVRTYISILNLLQISQQN